MKRILKASILAGLASQGSVQLRSQALLDAVESINTASCDNYEGVFRKERGDLGHRLGRKGQVQHEALVKLKDARNVRKEGDCAPTLLSGSTAASNLRGRAPAKEKEQEEQEGERKEQEEKKVVKLNPPSLKKGHKFYAIYERLSDQKNKWMIDLLESGYTAAYLDEQGHYIKALALYRNAKGNLGMMMGRLKKSNNWSNSQFKESITGLINMYEIRIKEINDYLDGIKRKTGLGGGIIKKTKRRKTKRRKTKRKKTKRRKTKRKHHKRIRRTKRRRR